jgi:phosphoglycolate phosphatase-like HAD superfamily hydrolase
MFYAAARDFSLRLDQTWYLGDDPRDCTAAWRAGCRCGYIGPPRELDTLPVAEKPAAMFPDATGFAEMLLRS